MLYLQILQDEQVEVLRQLEDEREATRVLLSLMKNPAIAAERPKSKRNKQTEFKRTADLGRELEAGGQYTSWYFLNNLAMAICSYCTSVILPT